jgi:hypothetical protein
MTVDIFRLPLHSELQAKSIFDEDFWITFSGHSEMSLVLGANTYGEWDPQLATW